jgi:carbonic anhydrase
MRKKMKLKLLLLCTLFSITSFAQLLTADKSLEKLIEGNKRFTAGNHIHPDNSPERIEELSKGQNPFAIILSCSDSRVPPEIIFDQGLGNLFIIRAAGNITDPVLTASIEYAAEHLHTPLLVVLGHEDCGAVKAAVADGDLGSNLNYLVSKIKPSVNEAKREGDDDLLSRSIKLNIETTIEELLNNSAILKELNEHDKLKIMGAIYNIENGETVFLK